MDNALTHTKYLTALLGGVITWLLGGWDMALQVLILFVALDYFTGLVAAWCEKKLDSSIGAKGIAKKILLFIPIAIACALDRALGQDILRSLAIWFYIANEGLSIVENLGRAGVPIPEPLKVALEQLKQKGEGINEAHN